MRSFVFFAALAIVLSSPSVLAKDKDPVMRWTEGLQGCTFSAGEDGLYRYAIWTEEFGVIVAVDADELRKAHSRTEPTFAVLLTVRYRGKDSLQVSPDGISLEFVKHDHDKQIASAPGDLIALLQKDSDRLAQRIERESKSRPAQKSAGEFQFQDQQKSIQAAIEFVKSQRLIATRLDSDHPQVSGWLFFNARSRWIGDWKKQEEFVLRVPLADHVIEFPFALPPSRGDLLLRKRPDE